MRCFSPGERSVPGNQDSGNGERIKMLEAAGNGNAGVEDIIAADFVWGQFGGYGNGAVKIIRMGGSIGGDFKAAWAHAVAYSEWVWTTPPTPVNSL